MNKAVLVGDESGKVFVNIYDWHSFFVHYKTIAHLKKFHHFLFESDNVGFVCCQEFCTSKSDVSFCLFTAAEANSHGGFPDVVTPAGLSIDRQWYLYENIRNLVPPRAQDFLCPKPICPRHTFAQTRKELQGINAKRKAPIEPETVQIAKRKPQTCSFCGCIGHINRILGGVPACPKRRDDPTSSPVKR